MGLAQLGDGDGGVDLGRVEAGVAKEFLDHAQVSSVFQKVGGAGMTEQMAAASFAELRAVDRFA